MPYNKKSSHNLIQNSRTPKEKAERKTKAKAKKQAVFRNKKNLKNLCVTFLSLPAKGKESTLLKEMGIDEDERVNALAFIIKLYKMFMDDGDLKAAELFLKIAGYDPEIAIKQLEAKAKVEALKATIGDKQGGSSGEAENDVIIMLPENNRQVVLPDRQDNADNSSAADDPDGD